MEQGLECADRLIERYLLAPMQQIEIQAICLETPQTALARVHGSASSRIVRQHLANQKDLVTVAGDSFSDELLGAAIGVHLSRVDEGHPQVNAGAQRLYLHVTRMFSLRHAPCALPEHGDRLAIRQCWSPDCSRDC